MGDSTLAEELSQFILTAYDSPTLSPIASELEALQAIYGEDAVFLHHVRNEKSSTDSGAIVAEEGGMKIRYEINATLPEDPEVVLNILVTLPPLYPASFPPQLQLLNVYIGHYSVDSALFGTIIRTYITAPPPLGDGVPFNQEEVAVWEGIERTRNLCQTWYTKLQIQTAESSQLRLQEHLDSSSTTTASPAISRPSSPPQVLVSSLPPNLQIHVSEPIFDRKSSFVGRAVRITSVDQIPTIINFLLSDRKIARAAHPTIYAYRVLGENGVLHQDNDDDGESAAGGRIAHLLQILDVKNVVVIVTRYFGGIHLGADRFKHINQAARDVLEIGGFLSNEKDTVADKHRRKK